MYRALPFALLLAAVTAAGCARSPDSLEVYFSDELVEAPARSVQIVAIAGTTCEAVLSVTHDATPVGGQVLLRTTTTYPVDPRLELLDSVPRGTPIAVSIAAYDANELLVARACELVNLDPSEPVALKVRMHALPQCPDKPLTALDLMLVLDTSLAMSIADTEATHITELKSRVIEALELPEGSTWSMVVHGHIPPAQTLLPTASKTQVSEAVDAVAAEGRGPPLVYDAVYLASGLLRARAVCGRRPALLVLSGGEDGGSTRLVEDAIVGLVGERGDTTDDLFTFGIAMTLKTYDTLNAMIPEDIGVATGAETASLRSAKLREAALALRGLVP